MVLVRNEANLAPQLSRHLRGADPLDQLLVEGAVEMSPPLGKKVGEAG
jgi:hypothetical protein